MSDLPHEVLSEHFQERMHGCRLVAAVFLTYQFDPGFFEQEVLPVFVDVPLSHVATLRLAQLEDAIRGIPGGIAVYYDASGLVLGDAGSARLDIRRIPVRHKTGIFHPKNVFLLVEDDEPDEDGYRSRRLLVACMSCNLTRSGWWENVECCHLEEIHEGDRTRLKDDLASFLRKLRTATPGEAEPQAVHDILGFLKSIEQRRNKSVRGHIHAHFYNGREPLADFIASLVGPDLQGTYLEVISPYFDDRAECRPLTDLIERFAPRAVQVYLPRSDAGEAAVRQDLYESVASLANVQWSRFEDKRLLRRGTAEDAGNRFVHAKVYRFFRQNPKREITFIGSANLTTAAHGNGGNIESGFLIDNIPDRRPDFWTVPDSRKPSEFVVRTEDDGAAVSGGSRLTLRYHWDRGEAHGFWDATAESPPLVLKARDVELGSLPPLPPREWTVVAADLSRRIGEFLPETSLFEVHGESAEPALLLVQEEGMSHKPSLLLRLSAADILRYWSLLTPEQRAGFIEAHGPELSPYEQGADLVAKYRREVAADTLFDRFAGFFHGFGCLERAVTEALEEQNSKEADYRLFGRKYDSLGSLLDRIQSEGGQADPVDQYVVILCARQVCQRVAKEYPEYWKAHKGDTTELENRFAGLETVRSQLIETNGAEFAAFLDWFDQWFLKPAARFEMPDD
jgi:hypothetical protein